MNITTHLNIYIWKRLFAGTLPANKKEFAGTVPSNKNEFAGTVPANKIEFAVIVPANKNEFPELFRKIRSNIIFFDSNFKASEHLKQF